MSKQLIAQCPYINPATGERCEGSWPVNVSDLQGRKGISGNGPGAHWIRYYPKLNHRCKVCEQFADGATIIENNPTLLAHNPTPRKV